MDLPGERRGGAIERRLVGLKLAAEPSAAGRLALGDAAEVLLFAGGYCGVQPSDDGRLNVCLAIRDDRLKTIGRPIDVFERLRRNSPRGASLLGDATFHGPPVAIAGTPYGFVRTATRGAYHVGDQAAVIPSFCGEGMAIALLSGRLAAEAILDGEPPATFQRRLARRLGPRVRATALLSHAATSGLVQSPIAALARTAPALLRAFAEAVRAPI